MRALRRACRNVAALLISLTGLTCRDSAAPTGTGRIAPTTAALAFDARLPADADEVIIPIRQARIRLFRLPGEVPERAVLDTVLPFLETDTDRAVTLGVRLTMSSERFGIELALLDDRAQVAYLARDTVTAYSSGAPSRAASLRLRYVGADTAVARIALASRDTVLSIGDALSLRPTAFLRDGGATTARFGFVVHGTSAITVDRSGTLRATGVVAPGTAWVVTRIVTGLADSIGVSAIVPARSVDVTPASGRVVVGRTLTLGAVVRDSVGAALANRQPTWTSSDPAVATVSEGEVRGVSVGSALITASSGRAAASANVTVLPSGIVRVVPSTDALVLDVGQRATISATAYDALDQPVLGVAPSWKTDDAGVVGASAAASSSDPVAASLVGIAAGTTTVRVRMDAVEGSVSVRVRGAPATSIAIARTSTEFSEHGEVATFVATIVDGSGALVANAMPRWQLSGSATLLDASGASVRVLLQSGQAATLTVSYGGSTASIVVVGATAPGTVQRPPEH